MTKSDVGVRVLMRLCYDCFSHRLQQGAANGWLDGLPGRVLLTVVATGLVAFVVGLGVVAVAVEKTTGQKTDTKTTNKQETPPRGRRNTGNPFEVC